MYRNDAVCLAADRRRTERPRPIADDVEYVARRLLFSVRALSASDKQFLGDLARSEHRYPMKALDRLTEIAARSDRPEDREVLAEMIRARCLRSTPAVQDVALAFDHETRATGPADVTQRAYERRPCRATKEAVTEALTTQLYATRAALDAVAASPVP